MTKEDISNHVACARPHNQRRGSHLFFLISRRPLAELCPDEITLYDSIDGKTPVFALENVCPGASERLLRWHRTGIIELIPPVSPVPSPHRVVIEPHMDDAALSVGGCLLNRRGQGRTTILSVVGRSNFTSYLSLDCNFVDEAAISLLRMEESVLASRLLGATHSHLKWEDAPLRLSSASAWHDASPEQRNEMLEIFSRALPSPAEVNALAEQLLSRLIELEPDELWFPSGLGGHPDHALTRRACFEMLANAHGRLSQIPVYMYEDVPHTASVPGQSERIRDSMAKHGTLLTQTNEDVTDVFQEKLRVLSVFGSQFKVAYMEPRVREVAERAAGSRGRRAEVYYQVRGGLHLPPESMLSPEAHGLGVLRNGCSSILRAGLPRHQVTVLALPSSHLGNAIRERESLHSAFPNVRLRVVGTPNALTSTGGLISRGVDLEFAGDGPLGWLAPLLRQSYAVGTPTIVLWRGAYAIGNKRTLKRLINTLLRILLPFRPVLFATTLRDVCCVLDELSANRPGHPQLLTHG